MPHLTPDLLSYELQVRYVMERLTRIDNAAKYLAAAKELWGDCSRELATNAAYRETLDQMKGCLKRGRQELRQPEPGPFRFPDRLE